MARLIILIVFIGSSSLCFAQNVFKDVDSLINNIHTEKPDIGISIGLLHSGEEYFFNYGNISKDSDHKVDNKTLFELGSVTKLMTTYLIAQHAATGKIDLNGFIDDYLPSHTMLNPAVKRKIKVSDLASHQSGLPGFDLQNLLATNSKQPFDEVSQEMLDSILVNVLDLNTLGSYRYSNISFVLLGQILEFVENDTYENILNKKLLSPLKMKSSLTSSFNDIKNQATGYDANLELRESFNWNSIFAPAGLVKSNSEDMLKFVSELLSREGKTLKESLEKTYFKNTNIELGLGLNILEGSENIIYAKSGDSLGQSCVLGYCPNADWGLIILTNRADGTARELFSEIINILN